MDMFVVIRKALESTPKDGSIYLLQKLSEVSGFFITDGHLLYLVQNFENLSHKSLLTDYLSLNTDVDIRSFKNNQTFPSGKYNVLEFLTTATGYDDSNLESFVNLCTSHTDFMDGKSFLKFFFSLSELFQEPKVQQYKNLVGLYGELSFIKTLCQTTGIDFSDRWHKGGSTDKYEITLDSKNIEIKTTAAVDGEVTIKHAQLFNADHNYLVAVCIEESSSGKTLNQLINSMQSDPVHYNNYNFVLNVEREKNRVSPIDADSKRFFVKSIRIYYAHEINPFSDIPECVSDLTYKLDLIDKAPIPEKAWETEFSCTQDKL